MRSVHQELAATVLGLALLSSALAQPTGSYGPSLVGDFGDPERLVLEGVKAFPADKVLPALTTDVDVMLAAHPAAPLDAYLTTLRDRLTAGYQNSGFRDVKATVEIDAKARKVRVHVVEGPRFMAGPVVVRGNHKISAEELIRWHTSPCPPEQAILQTSSDSSGKPVARWVDGESKEAKLTPPIWEPGKPVPFEQVMMKHLYCRTAWALAAQGYASTSFHVSTQRGPNEGTVSLVIDIDREGPPLVLGKVGVTGNQKNSRQEILDYLGWRPGMSLAVDWRAVSNNRLWRSGRFLEWTITPVPPTGGGNQTDVALAVTENRWSQRLSEPLSPEQTILLKLREQLTHRELWPGDLVAVAQRDGKTFELVVSSTDGITARLTGDFAPGGGAPRPYDLSLLVTDEHLGVLSTATAKGKFFWTRTESPESQILAQIELRLNRHPVDGDSPRLITFGLGTRTFGHTEPRQPLNVKIEAAPCFFAALPRTHNDLQFVIKDGIMTAARPGEAYRINAATGQLIEAVIQGENASDGVVRVHFQKNVFPSRRDKILAAAAELPNQFDAGGPWSSLAALLGDEDVMAAMTGDVTPEMRRWARFVRVMHRKRALEPIDDLAQLARLWKRSNSSDEPGFTIPSNVDPFASEQARGLSELNAILARAGLPLAEAMFPRRSWPWTVVRETTLIWAGRGTFEETELTEAWNSELTGTVFHFLTAVWFDSCDNPMALVYATRARGKLSNADFQKDCRLFLDKRSILGRTARRIAQAVRDLDQKEVDAILGEQRPGEASALTDFILTIRSQPDRPLDEAMLAALTAAWRGGLSDRADALLTEIRNRRLDFANRPIPSLR